MAARCRVFDWAATPLGPADAWPPHLRVAAALVLAGGLPMVLHYGPEAIQLYNDACAPSLGPQHPAALGRPLFASFPETRDAVAALHARVWRGETVTLTDQAFHVWRDGRLEEVVWTFSYAPLRDEQGTVAGVLVTAVDMSARTAAETARARLLAESEAARAAADLERRRLVTVLEQLPVGVTLAEAPSGRLLLSNAAVRRIWGMDTPSARVDDYSTDYVGYHTAPDARAGQPVASVEWPLARALTRGEVVADEVFEIRHPDGTRRMVSISAAPVHDADARVVGGVVTSLDVTERARLLAESERARAAAEAARAQLVDHALELELTNQQLHDQAAELEMQAEALRATAGALADRTREAERTAERDAFLAEASRLLASSLDPAITLGHVAELAVTALADWCGIDLVDAATGAVEPLAVAHADPSRVAWARQVRRDYPPHPDAPSGVPAVLRTGQAEFYPEVTDAMLLATARDAAHLALMREVGITSVIVTPLAARGRTLGALSLVSTSPGRRFTPEDLALAEEIGRRAGVALDHARAHAAEQAARVQAEESERRFRATADAAPVLIWTAGTDTLCDWFNQPWLAYCGRPMEAVLGNGWAEDVHPDDYDRCLATYLGAFEARAPLSMEYRLRRHDGAYRWLLDNAVPRVAADGTFVGYIGTCVDVSEQREAREAAEAAARRVAYLAEASARLAGSLDVEATLRTVAELAVPALADWSFVEVLERGRVRPMAVAHTQPEMVRLAHALLDRYPIDLEAPFGTGKVLRTGEPELNADIPDAALVAVAQDAEHLAALRQLGFRSSLSVPLTEPGGAAVAVLSLVSADPGRRYGEADLAMAEEVAHRGSVALAGARLYAAGQAALRRARGLQQVSDALAGRADGGRGGRGGGTPRPRRGGGRRGLVLHPERRRTRVRAAGERGLR
jgi:PAS domain S-box-containing protein